MVMSLPLALTLSVLHEEVSIRIDASKRGAILPPRVKDPYPGGAKALISRQQFKNGHPGDGIQELCEQLGRYTFNRRILFENRVRSSSVFVTLLYSNCSLSDYHCRA